MLRRVMESDRPTFNTLTYLTKISGHRNVRDQQLKGPYVEDALKDLLGDDTIDKFKEYKRSFYIYIKIVRTLLLKRLQDLVEMETGIRPENPIRISRSLSLPQPMFYCSIH